MIEKINEIMNLAFEDNVNAVFVRYCGHVRLLEVQVYERGWKGGATSDENYYISLADWNENAMNELDDCIKYLLKIKENNGS